ncbi:MAG: hypothetical protein ABW278_07315 [Steroidobacteraceae bacterium]
MADQRHLRVLALGAAAYLAATFLIQGLGSTPASRESAPIEISTDIVASLGLVYAALRALHGWRHALVRQSWLYASAGMFMVWCMETAVDRLALDYRIAISGWLCATLLLFRSMQAYSSRPLLPRIMWFGFLAQAVAHIAWIAMAELPVSVRGPDETLELTADTGELMSLLTYIVAFVTARRSGLDELVAGGPERLRSWSRGLAAGNTQPSRRLRICFPLIAQIHQAFHALPIAVALARRHPEIDVHVAALDSRLGVLQELVRHNAGNTRLRFDQLYLAWPWRLLERFRVGIAKILMLRANRHYLSGFDAVVVPERTSTYLRRICPQIRLIGTEHGAGDRAVAYSPQLARFDFLLLPGAKQARHLLELGYVRPGHYATGIYAKLDWALSDANAGPRLFDNQRTTVLYNPHFDPRLSSWPLIGRQVLDFFAASDRYNLIFAPHIRLFDPVTRARQRAFREYQDLPHMLVDLGSPRCVDMTYTRAADIYLGDVSSQVVEYITRPRPCVFLNPRGTDWQQDLHYRFWNLGTVVTDLAQLPAALAAAGPLPAGLRQSQLDYLRDSVGEVAPGHAADRGAQAIISFLQQQARPAAR